MFDDADLDAAIQGAVAASLINTGQDCTAATRAIVARDLYDDFVAGVGELMSKIVVGDPHDPDTDLGPLITHGAPRRRSRAWSTARRARAAASSPAAARPTCRARSTGRR